MSIEQKVKEFILDNFLFTDDNSALANEDSFLDKGIIDSTGIMEVIMFIEEQFGISVSDEEMIPDNLDSIKNIVRYINEKQYTA